MRMPVGWEAIEIYPAFNPDLWKPELATAWAEMDLLAAVTRRHLQENKFVAVDPNAAARKRCGLLLREYAAALSGSEEVIHQFLKDHPEILSPTHTAYWSKLPFGKRATDFVFREPPNDYMLVELEAPSRYLFRDDGQPRQELTHAIDQTLDWQRYLEDNLGTVQRELRLHGISVSPRYLIVMGRSDSLTEENRRKLVTIQNQVPRLRIITYDDVAANARSVMENLLGPLWDVGENVEVYFLPAR